MDKANPFIGFSLKILSKTLSKVPSEVPSQMPKKIGVNAMPLQLKNVIDKYGITQTSLGKSMTQISGKPLSRSAINQLIIGNSWPRKTPVSKLKNDAEKYLRQRGVTNKEIALIWDKENKNLGDATPNKALNTSPDIDLHKLPETEMLSQKAKQHFKLITDPFRNDVAGPDDVFLSAEGRYIRESMRYAAKYAGFMAIIGESGAGKSTLRRDLIDYIKRENEPLIVIQPRTIDKGRLSASAICDAIIRDISPDEKLPQTLEAKARLVETLLINSSRGSNAHVLMIEEAHDLTIPVLKYLKRFWELEDGHKKLLGIVLVGQPELKQKLDERINFDAREVIRRIEVAELMPLDGDLESYIAKKLNKVRMKPDHVMSADAYDAIRERLTFSGRGHSGQLISMVYPLVVNNLVTKAMNLAAEMGETLINAELIKEI